MAKRILLVEGHPHTRRALVKLLKTSGYDVVPTATKAEAIAACAKEQFDLLISDIVLSDGSGHQLMRELSDTCNIRGIAYTASDEDDDLAEACLAGFSGLVLKPSNYATLEDMVAKVLNGS